MNFEQVWIKNASKLHKTIVLPEPEFSERVLQAGLKSAEMGLCNVVLLCTSDKKLKQYDNGETIRVVNINTHDLTPIIISAYYVKRQHKGITPEQAKNEVMDPYVYGAMMVDLGFVDGMVGGAEAPSAKIFSSAFKTVKAKNGKASSFFVFLPTRKDQKLYVIADGGVILNPTAEELADITIDTVQSYRTLVGDNPNVALLSYSTKGSAGGESAEKVKKAYEILKSKKVDFVFDGELQLDAAIIPEVATKKCPNSPVKGNANILIFPDLQSGNIGYKLIQRFGGYKAIGPLVQGLNKPINDLSRGATVDEIIVAIAITILQK